MAYNSAYTGSQVDAAVGAVRQKETKWDNKQDELTGTEDQLVGFNSAGEAVAVAKPDPLPTGGETGQVLTKTAEGTAWDDIPSDLPAGGTDGQILTKTADGVAWEDAPEGGVTSFKGRTGAVTPQEGDYTADMVGARPDTWMPSASDVGAVPTSRTVNGKALSSNITLDADDVGALDQTSADARYLQLSGGTMTGALALPGNPTSDNQAANKYYVDNAIEDAVNAVKSLLRTATLTTSGWSNNSQTVTVAGVVADTSAQRIDVSPDPADDTSWEQWGSSGVRCKTQGSNSLTFVCTTVPTANISLQISIEEARTS